MKRQACKRLLDRCGPLRSTDGPHQSCPTERTGADRRESIAVSAYVERGVTYVPLRALLNTMGDWDIWWDKATGRAAAASG
ncbi:MAG: stalk domain-containing protein [Dysosmobacter sp.]